MSDAPSSAGTAVTVTGQTVALTGTGSNFDLYLDKKSGSSWSNVSSSTGTSSTGSSSSLRSSLSRQRRPPERATAGPPGAPPLAASASALPAASELWDQVDRALADVPALGAVITRLSAELATIVKSPAGSRMLVDSGMLPRGSTAPEFAALLKRAGKGSDTFPGGQ